MSHSAKRTSEEWVAWAEGEGMTDIVVHEEHPGKHHCSGIVFAPPLFLPLPFPSIQTDDRLNMSDATLSSLVFMYTNRSLFDISAWAVPGHILLSLIGLAAAVPCL